MRTVLDIATANQYTIRSSPRHTHTRSSRMSTSTTPCGLPVLVERVLYAPIVITPEMSGLSYAVEYTDCVEVSFLRVLQLLHLDLDLLPHCQRLDLALLASRLAASDFGSQVFAFMSEYQCIEDAAWFDTEAGVEMRTRWGHLLNEQPERLVYNRPKPLDRSSYYPPRELGRFEVQANHANHIELFRMTFNDALQAEFDRDPACVWPVPLVGTRLTYQPYWSAISSFLSRAGLEVVFHVALVTRNASRNNMRLDLRINNDCYWTWDITQVMNDDVRLSGHSELTDAWSWRIDEPTD